MPTSSDTDLKYLTESSSNRMVIGFLSIEAYGFLRAFEKSYSLRIFITFNKLLTLWQLPYEPK